MYNFYPAQQLEASNSYLGQMEYTSGQLFQPMSYFPFFPDNTFEGFWLWEIKTGFDW